MDTKPMPQRRLVFIGAGVLVISVAVAAYFLGTGSHHGTELTFYGNVDIREVTVGFRGSGRLASLSVDEGDAVHAGQEIARLDTTPLQLELNESRANAEAIGKRMALLRSGFRPEEIAVARATVAERQATLTHTEQSLARQEQLKGTGAVAQRVYDDALAARDEARARLQAAQQTLAEQRHGFRVQEVEEAEANRARAVAAAAQAEQRLADAILTAPADGVVLTRAVESGAILAAGTPVFTISLREPVWARIYVSEPDLGRVPPGMDVLLYTDGRPKQPYHGRIGFVSSTAEFTPKSVETSDLRTALVYRARVIVSDPDSALRQGMPVTVRASATGTSADEVRK